VAEGRRCPVMGERKIPQSMYRLKLMKDESGPEVAKTDYV